MTDQPGSDDATGGAQPPVGPPPPPYGGPPVPPPPAGPAVPPPYGAPPAPAGGEPSYATPPPPAGPAPAYGAPAAPGAPPMGAQYGTAQYGAPAAAGAKTETTAILGLVFAFLIWPVGLVLSIVGLTKTKKNGTSGGGLAIAGIIVSVLAAVASVFTVVLLIAAASSTSDALDDASRDLSSALASAEAEASALPDEDIDETPDASAVAAFGEGFEFEDGVVVQVSQPAAFTPSEYAYIGTSGFTSFVSFDVTVTNNSTEPFQPLMMSFAATSGGVAGEDIYDSESNVTGMGPDGDVLPGNTVTFTVAYAVQDPADLQLDVSTGFDYDTVYFTSAGS